MSDRSVILFISMSLDGFIATNDDDISWLSMVERPGEDYGYSDIIDATDTYILGRATYDLVFDLTGGTLPHSTTHDCYVLIREDLIDENGVQFYNGSLSALIGDLKKKPGKGVFCDGGGQVVRLFMEHDLIDEYVISIIPTMLGDGKRLFLGGTKSIDIELVSSRTFDSGLVQLRYARAGNSAKQR